MTHQLRLRHLENRYRLPPDLEDPAQVASLFDRVATGELPQAIDVLLPGILAARGLSATSEIAIRRLSVRLRAVDAQVDPGALTAAWTRAFADALDRALRTSSEGDTDTDAVIFEDRIAAELGYLIMRARGLEHAWWWRVLLEEHGRLPTPTEVVSRWIEREPERVAAAFMSLVDAAPQGVATLFTASEAQVLVERIFRARDRRLIELAGAPLAEAPEDLADAFDAKRIPPTARQALRSTPTRDLQRLIALLAVTAQAPSCCPRDLKALGAWLDRLLEEPTKGRGYGSRWQRRAQPKGQSGETTPTDDTGLGNAAVIRRDTARETQEHGPSAQPETGRVREPRLSNATTSSPSSPSATPSEEVRSDDRDTREPSEVRVSPLRLDSATEAAMTDATIETTSGFEHEVGCAGLLFIIRRLARLPLVREHSGPPLEARLLAFGQLVLNRLLGPLPEAARRAAFERERPLLAVFTGMAELPDALHEPPSAGEALDDAATALAEVAAAIPAATTLSPNGLSFTYGMAQDPFLREGFLWALARLVLRPARLQLTRTHADLYLSMRAVDVALRQGGWDIDPGWVPYLGRVIRFHYQAS